MVKPLQFDAVPKVEIKKGSPLSFGETAKKTSSSTKGTPIFGVNESSDDVVLALRESGMQDDLQTKIKIQSLLPLNIKVITEWSSSTLSLLTPLNDRLMVISSTISMLDAYKKIQDVANSSTKSLFWRRDVDHQSIMTTLRQSMTKLLDDIDDIHPEISKLHNNIASSLAALKGVASLCVDDSIRIAINNKRTTLSHCLQQCDLSLHRCNADKNTIIDVIGKIEHMLHVVIPVLKASK